jgi:hypothetical protein
MMDEPLPVTDDGANAAVTPAGNPVTASPTLPLNPFTAETVTVYAALLPAATDWLGGPADTEKSVTATVTAAVWLRLPLVPVIVSG